MTAQNEPIAWTPPTGRIRDVPRFLLTHRVEKIGRWRTGDERGWRVCIRRRDPACWSNVPAPTLWLALSRAVGNVRPPTPRASAETEESSE